MWMFDAAAAANENLLGTQLADVWDIALKLKVGPMALL